MLRGAVLLIAASSFAGAQTPCFEPAFLTSRLSEMFDETPVSIGRDAEGKSSLVVYASRNGSWTLVIKNERSACVVASGSNWVSTCEGGSPVSFRPNPEINSGLE